MTKLQKTLLAGAISSVLAVPSAFAATGTMFDPDGAGTDFDPIKINQFSFSPGNTLATDSTKNHEDEYADAITRILIQARAADFNIVGGGTHSYASTTKEVTMQLSVRATPTITGGAVTWADDGSDADNFFRLYYDATADSLGPASLTGCGFGAASNGVGACAAGGDGGILILEGRVTLQSMNWEPSGGADQALDTFGSNNNAPITTTTANGSGQFQIDITFADDDFFPGQDPDAINFDIELPNLNGTPLSTANAWDVVVNRAVDGAGAVGTARRLAAYGPDDINNVGAGSCGDVGNTDVGGDGICDLHMLASPSASILAAPEPTGLALIGAGLIGAGLVSRRRKA